MPNERESAYCAACGLIVPIVRPVMGRVVGSVAPAVAHRILGKGGTKSILGTLLVAVIGLALGYAVDRSLKAVCGHCGGAVDTALV